MTTIQLRLPGRTSREPTTIEATQTDARRRATKDTLPILVALVPFALTIGTATAAADLGLGVGLVGGIALLAGAAQLAVTDLLANDAGVVSTVATAALINLRFTMYSAGFATWFANEPLRRQLWMVYPLVDQSFVLSQTAFETNADAAWRRRYYLTVSALLATTFLAFQAVGYYVGASVPAAMGLHLGGVFVFAGLLAVSATSRPDLTAAGVGGAVAVAASTLPSGLAIPIAAIAGVLVGSVLLEDR